MGAQTLLDAVTTAARFGVSVPRISEWYRDRETTGYPEPVTPKGPRRQWAEEDLERWFTARRSNPKLEALRAVGDPEDYLNTSEVAAMLGVKSILPYLARPGYFPEADDTEVTKGGYVKRHWRRRTIVEWMANRRGRGNRGPKTRHETPLPAAEGERGETVNSAEAARMLGYANTASFSSAYAQGHLEGLGDPVTLQRTSGRGRPSRLWPRQMVEQVAHQRRLAEEAELKLQGERKRLAEEAELRRRQVCRAALDSVGGAKVTAKALFEASSQGGSFVEWKFSLASVRKELRAG